MVSRGHVRRLRGAAGAVLGFLAVLLTTLRWSVRELQAQREAQAHDLIVQSERDSVNASNMLSTVMSQKASLQQEVDRFKQHSFNADRDKHQLQQQIDKRAAELQELQYRCDQGQRHHTEVQDQLHITSAQLATLRPETECVVQPQLPTPGPSFQFVQHLPVVQQPHSWPDLVVG